MCVFACVLHKLPGESDRRTRTGKHRLTQVLDNVQAQVGQAAIVGKQLCRTVYFFIPYRSGAAPSGTCECSANLPSGR
jgi:hypothetical protein